VFLLVSQSLLLTLLPIMIGLTISFFSCTLIRNLSYSLYVFDETSLLILYVTFLVVSASILVVPVWSLSVSISTLLLFVSCVFVFCSNNMFVIYIAFELSLLPIIYIIITIGVYPDRTTASLYLLAYTSLLALPFSFLLFHIYSSYHTFSILLPYTPLSRFSTLLLFLTFSVKLPIYGLHHWLPIAHVEAPTFGSILLAGVLLKLGGVGLIRFSSLLDISTLQKTMLSYSIVFISLVTLICISQSDFKRLVAYSSVSHIILIPILIMLNTNLSFKVITIVMFFHALSSPLLFAVVGSCYSIYSSRMLAFSRGLLTLNPLFSTLVLIGFLLTLSVPPTPSFLAEVLFVVSLYISIPSSMVFLALFIFLSLAYNLHWFSPTVFQSSSLESSVSTQPSFKDFLSQFFLAFVNLPCLLLIFAF